jgi:hypothetical protein
MNARQGRLRRALPWSILVLTVSVTSESVQLTAKKPAK